jgi:phospholipase C
MPPTISRRRFSRLTAVPAVLGALGAACRPQPDPVPPGKAFPQFRHVVVLMFENRSLDNVLGWLYETEPPPRGASFAGVAGMPLSNPIPPDFDAEGRGAVPVGKGWVMDQPNPDPGEGYAHVNTQLFGTVLPAANATLPDKDLRPPYNLTTPAPAAPAMSGFVTDYVNQLYRDQGRPPAYDEYRRIMDCFPPAALPVFNTLARRFAVFDHWFAAVPSQTYTNRAFFHAASSSGKVDNLPNAFWIKDNTAETIFNRISDARRRGLSWRVYWDPADGISLTGLIHFPRLHDYFGSNFAHMAQFYRDARAGRLPAYSFIEPRFIFRHNDAHPPVAELGEDPYPSSVLAAELLLNDVYNAVRTANNPDGSNWQNTLLLVTFDEHGGCYDHVPPPAAVPPDPAAPAGEMGFRFDRAGVRVPAIVVSAYVEEGTVVNAPFEHTTLIRTLAEQWDLGHLTARDAAAPTLGGIFNRTTPRPPAAWPVISPRPFDWRSYNNVGSRLNDLQFALAGLASSVFDDLGTLEHGVHTVRDALELTKRAGQRLRLL